VHAVIFDIDGTLLDSFEDDAALYVDAIRHVIGQVNIREAWEHYPRVSDTGILSDICQDNALAYDDALSDSIRDVFIGRLKARMDTHGPYREIPGALEYLKDLRLRPDVQIAYATGGWRASAELKLKSAGFPLEDIPLASANDHPDRQHIMLHALAQLQGPFTSITYFGDGVWDRLATAALGWQFVAVGPKLGGLSTFDAVSPNNRMQRSGSP
jgi:FMN phosphatase YigB (HAD superfamily)